MWKFKSWTGKDKWLFLLTIGVILCVLAFPLESINPQNKTNINSITSTQSEGVGAATPVAAGTTGDKYEDDLEKRVKALLKTVEGVGEVDVMIVLKSSKEKVIRIDKTETSSITKEKDASGGDRSIENKEDSEATVLTTGNGTTMPIVEKELLPQISGIVISATGGDSLFVRAEISAAMVSLFDLPAHKIKVLKRVE